MFILVIYAWGVAGSLCISKALIATIDMFYIHYSTKNASKHKSYILWTSVTISISFSTLLLTYFSRLMTNIRKQRKKKLLKN